MMLAQINSLEKESSGYGGSREGRYGGYSQYEFCIVNHISETLCSVDFPQIKSIHRRGYNVELGELLLIKKME